VLDHEDGDAELRADIADPELHVPRFLRGQPGSWLVQKDDPGLHGERPTDFHHLAGAVREPGDPLFAGSVQIEEVDDPSENVVSILVAEFERIGLDREVMRERLEDALRADRLDYENPALESLAVLFPEHIMLRQAWSEILRLLATGGDSGGPGVRAQSYFAVAYAATESSEVLAQIKRDLNRLTNAEHTYFENLFTRHATQRLRRDPIAASIVRQAVLDHELSDSLSAQLASLLVESVGQDEDLLNEVERRVLALSEAKLAPVVRDHVTSATVPVRTIFTRIADASLDARSN